jgi:hypothetical protein
MQVTSLGIPIKQYLSLKLLTIYLDTYIKELLRRFGMDIFFYVGGGRTGICN